jgi:SulP family sulfate permease
MKLVHGLHFRNLYGDLTGGLTAAVVALPLAMAFGVASGAGPIAGIYGAIFVGFFAALFGGTPSQVSGPTGPMTVVMAAVLTQYLAMFPDDPAKGAALAFTVVMLGGLLQIVLGLARVGRYIDYVPAPVISGFMSGIGVIIILLQLYPLLGQPVASSPIKAAAGLPALFAHGELGVLAFGLATLAIVFFLPHRIARIVPAPLVALIVVSLAVALIDPGPAVTLIGDIPSGFPKAQAPILTIALLPKMLESAITLALLGAIDSLLTSLVADNVTRTQHDSNRELIGQGIGNTIAGLFGGLPGAGATMRTVINVRSGGRTPLSGALHALVLLALVLGLGPLASHIPHVVLAGILIKVGVDIIDWDYLKRLRSAPRVGLTIMATVLLMTVFVDLITAVAVGMIIASFVFMKRMTDLQIASMRLISRPEDEAPLSDAERALIGAAGGRLLLFHLSGAISFSSAKELVRRASEVDDYGVLVLDLTDVSAIDYTSSRAIEDIIVDALARKRAVYLCGLRTKVHNVLARDGVLRHIAGENVRKSRADALAAAAAALGVGSEAAAAPTSSSLSGGM